MTDELKEKLIPVRHRLRELEETRAERIEEARTTRGGNGLLMNALDQALSMATRSETGRGTAVITQGDIMRAVREEHEVFQGEAAYRDRDRRELEELVDQELRGDVGCSISGLYDLVGAFLHSHLSFHFHLHL